MVPMSLVFFPEESTFAENLWELRTAVVNHLPFAPKFAVVLHNGRGVESKCPYVRVDGWFEYNGIRCPIEEIGKVTFYWD